MEHNGEQFFKEQTSKVDAFLESCINGLNKAPELIQEAVRYSLFGGGKRVRPVLSLAVCGMLNGDEETALAGGCAVELMHTYSLIHDDLPCMDDDDMRRGRPSSHIQFNEATAILAGDALQALAFEVVSSKISDPETALSITHELSRAAGMEGMVGGQVLDLSLQDSLCSEDELRKLDSMKTGELLTLSIRIGGHASKCSSEELNILTEFGSLLGLLFQVVDDILDIEGDPEKLGKTAGKDEQNRKLTFPGLMGVTEAKEYRETLYKQTCKKLEKFPGNGTLLQLCDFIAHRDH